YALADSCFRTSSPMNDPDETLGPSPGDPKSTAAKAASDDKPERIGRYRIEKVLGEGGFGRVYLAHDDQLQRAVAIKVPHRELVATVAEALHHAHKQGLVHRDIKPGNILLDRSGKPFVADFGLALREQDVGKGPRYAGTPAYMSPEQARGEGHRVDGRSDIFSLAVVFYELL